MTSVRAFWLLDSCLLKYELQQCVLDVRWHGNSCAEKCCRNDVSDNIAVSMTTKYVDEDRGYKLLKKTWFTAISKKYHMHFLIEKLAKAWSFYILYIFCRFLVLYQLSLQTNLACCPLTTFTISTAGFVCWLHRAFKDQWTGTIALLSSKASCIMKLKCISMYQQVNKTFVLYWLMIIHPETPNMHTYIYVCMCVSENFFFFCLN